MRSVEGWENYLVSEDGNIWSVRKERFLTLKKDKGGYLRLCLYHKCKYKNVLIHRLIAQAFLPNPNNFKEINHIDGNKENNHVTNLEWVNRSKNVKHSFDTGLHIHKKGEDWHTSKLKYEDVTFIKENYRFRDKQYSTITLGERFNVHPNTIRDVIKGITWKA